MEKWAHELRDVWRHELLRRAAKNRPQHYGDVLRLDMKRTMILYNEWDLQALRTGDENTIMRQGVLRRLLTGGLLTEERNARHHKDATPARCACGAEPTVLHISWHCPIYNPQRAPLQNAAFAQLPTCTRYSGLILKDSKYLTDTPIKLLQSVLVSIWQLYIQAYKSGQHQEETPATAIHSDPAKQENGHLLKPRPNGLPGVFCCRCGKYVARSKHIRLKITRAPCTQKHSEVELTQEGFSRSQTRLDNLFGTLNRKYNRDKGHVFSWNRKIGKNVGAADEGILQCKACTRVWKWKDRANILTSSRCNGPYAPDSEASPAILPSLETSSDPPNPKQYTRCKPCPQQEPQAQPLCGSNSPVLPPPKSRLRSKTRLQPLTKATTVGEGVSHADPGSGAPMHTPPVPSPGHAAHMCDLRTKIG